MWGLATFSRIHTAALIGIAAFFTAGAVGHFLLAPLFIAIVPDYLPAAHWLVAISGVCELAGALGILVPAARRAAGIGLLVLVVAVFPANVNMALHPTRFDTLPGWLLIARLPLQVVILAWIAFAMRLAPGTPMRREGRTRARVTPLYVHDLPLDDESVRSEQSDDGLAGDSGIRPAAVTDRVSEIAANSRGRDYMVGDIHGHFFLLERLLAYIGFEPARDRVFSVGDLIDRGPDSHRTAEFLDLPWFFAIRGNHEQMLLNALTPDIDQADNRQLWRMNGGRWFNKLDAATAQAIHARIAGLPHAFEIEMADGGRAGLIHADVFRNDWRATRRLLAEDEDDVDEDDLLRVVWGRERARRVLRRLSGDTTDDISVAHIDLVAFGHTPMPAALACANTCWLDTGAFDGGRLTVAEIATDGMVWSLDALHGTFHSGWQWLEN